MVDHPAAFDRPACGWWYDVDWQECERCRGTGENVECVDDICHAKGYCMHGDNVCALCNSLGVISAELAERWYSRDAFEAVSVPDADLRRRGHLHGVARERHGREVATGPPGGEAGAD